MDEGGTVDHRPDVWSPAAGRNAQALARPARAKCRTVMTARRPSSSGRMAPCPGEQQALLGKEDIDFGEQPGREPMGLEEVKEVEDGGFVGHGVGARVESDKAPQKRESSRASSMAVAVVEPLLYEVNTQHDKQFVATVAVTGLGIDGFDDCLQTRQGTMASISIRNFSRGACLGFLTRSSTGMARF